MKSRLIRIDTLTQMIGLSRSTVYNLIRSNQFPQPIKIGDRAVAWSESEVEDWISNKIETPRR
jgi:prophage regulatory protein